MWPLSSSEGDGCSPGVKCLESKMLGLSTLNDCISFFPNMIILLLLYFTSCHPPHSLPVLPCLPPPLWCFQRRKKNLRTRKKNKPKFSLCCLYIHWSMLKLPAASPLQKPRPSLPTPPPEAVSCGALHFSILITNFENSLW